MNRFEKLKIRKSHFDDYDSGVLLVKEDDYDYLIETIDNLKQENYALLDLVEVKNFSMSMFQDLTEPSQAIDKLQSLIDELNEDLKNVKNEYTNKLISDQVRQYENTISDIKIYYKEGEINE